MGDYVNTSDVENYPGFPTISGPELADNMYRRGGCNSVLNMHTVKFQKLIRGKQTFKVITAGKKTYYAYAVVIATGSYHRKLEVPGEGEIR